MTTAPVRALVVDDSRTVRAITRRILERHGMVVSEAGDGAQALEAARASPVDLVVLDWNMPVMGGLDFLRALRAENAGGGPVVVFCTSESSIETISAGLGAGAQEYVMKPFDEDILVGKLQSLGVLA